jgi:hypothetical protein
VGPQPREGSRSRPAEGRGWPRSGAWHGSARGVARGVAQRALCQRPRWRQWLRTTKRDVDQAAGASAGGCAWRRRVGAPAARCCRRGPRGARQRPSSGHAQPLGGWQKWDKCAPVSGEGGGGVGGAAQTPPSWGRLAHLWGWGKWGWGRPGSSREVRYFLTLQLCEFALLPLPTHVAHLVEVLSAPWLPA